MRAFNFLVFSLLAVFIVSLSPASALAGYPMISGLKNFVLAPGQATETVKFYVTDDRTSPDQLVLETSSDNPALVPNDGAHIILGGRGSDRTIRVVPAAAATGTAIITVKVTDTDGETNQDTFLVEVVQPR